MKTYEASEELIEILLNNGFEDRTEKDYPEHFGYMKSSGYKPDSIKRKFAHRSHGDYVIFDYININAFGGHAEIGSRINLTTDELKSLITFYKMPASFRGKWCNLNSDLFQLHVYYKKICAEPLISNSADDKRLKALFEGVKLN